MFECETCNSRGHGDELTSPPSTLGHTMLARAIENHQLIGLAAAFNGGEHSLVNIEAKFS